MVEILLAKLLPPRVGKGIINRPRLINLLKGFEERKLTLIQAPAGYGKTVLMLQLATETRRSLAWFQLDIYDNDPAVFLQYLITGIRSHIPEFGIQAEQLIEEGNTENFLRLIVTAIVNEISQHADYQLLLAFDDYQVISDPLIQRFMQDFLEHLPDCVHVMIASRTLPSLNVSRLKTQSEVLSVGIEDLRFTDDETNDFLDKRTLQLTSLNQQLLKEKINGWPAALKLLTDAAMNANLPLQTNSGMAEIYTYLANEVLEQQPDEIRDFLLSTAVLETINPESCNLLLERNDSGPILDYLEKQQLFLIPLAGPEKAYRYHQLFRDFLIERLGEKKEHLLHKAGEIALQSGNLDQAIEYYLIAGVDQDLLSLLEKAGKEAFRQGRWQTVERWLRMLSLEQILADEWLCFFQAQIKIYQGKLDEAEFWVEGSLDKFTKKKDTTGIAECQFLQARILNGHGRNKESLVILEKANPVLQAETNIRFDLPLEMAFALSRIGRFQDANQLLNQALKTADALKDYWIMPHLLEGLGNTFYWMGDHTNALKCYQKGIKISPNQILPNYNFQDFVASIYQEWGELDLAFEYAQRSVTIKENLGMIEALPSAYYQLGNIYIDFGEFKKAETFYRRGIELAENGGERHFLSLNKAYLTRCLAFQGRLTESLTIAEQVLAEAQTQSETLLASCQVICAPTFIQNGNIPKAQKMLMEALPRLEQWQFAVPLSYGYGTLAVLNFKMGNREKAGELSRKLLDLAARKNLVRLFLTIAEYQSILRYGMEHGIEVYFIQRLLVRLGKRAVSLLTNLAGHEEPEVRRSVITPLCEIGTENAVSMLKRLSEDSNPSVRQSAVEALERFDPITSELQLKTKSSILEIKTLGSLRIFKEGTEISPINWRTSKTRDLLAFLTHQRNPVYKETIIEVLWPDNEFKKAQGLFHTSLYYLRQILEKIGYPDLIVYQNKQYQLAAKLFSTDRTRFQKLVIAGFNDETSPEKIADFLERAVALYSGDYLQELDYVWLLPDREYFKNLYFEARLRLARYYLDKKDYNHAISHLQLLTALDPLSEEIHRLLMFAHAGMGNRSAVKEQYQSLKLILKNELGLEPCRETQTIFNQLYKTD